MDVATLALLLEPAACLGGVVTTVMSLCVLLRYSGSARASLEWYLGNWRMRQTLGVSALFYFALTASCIVLHDRWGWLYALVAFKLGLWWWKRLLSEDVTLHHLPRSRSRARA